MSNYRWSTDSYRPTASNHVDGIRHDGFKTLYVKYYNQAEYKYWPVTWEQYLELDSAPSHGCYIFDHFKNNPMVFCDKISNSTGISNNPKKLQKDSSNSELVGSILPENKKLDALDKQQQELDRLFKDNRIGYSEHEKLSYIIDKKKEPLLVKLEKIGYFEGPDQVLEELDEQFDGVFNQELDIEIKKSIGDRMASKIHHWITKPSTKETIKSILTGTAKTLWITTLLTIQALKMMLKGYMMLMGLIFGIIGALMN